MSWTDRLTAEGRAEWEGLRSVVDRRLPFDLASGLNTHLNGAPLMCVPFSLELLLGALGMWDFDGLRSGHFDWDELSETVLKQGGYVIVAPTQPYRVRSMPYIPDPVIEMPRRWYMQAWTKEGERRRCWTLDDCTAPMAASKLADWLVEVGYVKPKRVSIYMTPPPTVDDSHLWEDP